LVTEWFKKPVCRIYSPCQCEYPIAPVIDGLQGIGARSPLSLQAQTIGLVSSFSLKPDHTETLAFSSLALPNLKTHCKSVTALAVGAAGIDS